MTTATVTEMTMRTVILRHRATWTRSDWFSEGNMRFFGTRLTTFAYRADGAPLVYFVASHLPPNEKRKYSVHSMDWETGEVNTVGEFCGYRTRGAAHNAVQKLVEAV